MSDTMPGPEADPEASAGQQEAASGPTGPESLGVTRTATGNAEVDARIERLADVDHLATDGHIEVYEDVHRGLRDALTSLDARQGPPAPAPGPATAPRPGPSYNHRS
ncbi:hypothetical protein P8605_28545 [Streptomyces sp. T-3]|nr:hypothetical protein [Streptomyces sp. T-3]